MSVPDDHELLSAARGGDPDALETLLARHQAQIYRFGLKMCRSEEDAKDVLQDTLLAMARGVRDFRGASSLSTWLYTIARSYCLKKRRRPKAAPHEETSLEAHPGVTAALQDPGRPPDEAMGGQRLEEALGRAIRELEPGYREVLLLRDVEGLTAPEVAEVLGLSIAAVKSRLHRARAAVRDKLAPFVAVPAEMARVATSEPRPAASSALATRCPDIVDVFSRHLEDDLSADVCAQMERHLADCPRCRGACDALRRTLVLCREQPLAEVPPAVQASVRDAVARFLAQTRA